MLKLIQNNDITVSYFKDWIGAVEHLSTVYKDKIDAHIALGPDQFNNFFVAFCEDNIEIYEGDNGSSRYKVKVRN